MVNKIATYGYSHQPSFPIQDIMVAYIYISYHSKTTSQ